MIREKREYDGRTFEQLREHYEIEKKLADRLRSSSREERQHLYTDLYNELYRRVPQHPQLTRKLSPEDQRRAIDAQLRVLSPFLSKDKVFLEVGAGDCAVSFEVARIVRQVYALDISEAVIETSTRPDNFALILSDGCSMPVSADSIDVAYSNQLMEHVHPDDALEQLSSIHKVIAPGGAYICRTPNRLKGPHDISRYFDRVATGFHLKEYSTTELAALFRTAGFGKVTVHCRIRGRCFRVPLLIVRCLESVLAVLPYPLRKAIAWRTPFDQLLGIEIARTKLPESGTSD